jgi:hypothetical protein
VVVAAAETTRAHRAERLRPRPVRQPPHRAPLRARPTRPISTTTFLSDPGGGSRVARAAYPFWRKPRPLPAVIYRGGDKPDPRMGLDSGVHD